MKIIVDELPKTSQECLFSEFIQLPNLTTMRKCMFLCGDIYAKCRLDCGEKCPYLKKGDTDG